MMKLCDIEDGLRDIQPSLGREYQLSLLSLLAHVRALDVAVNGSDAPVPGVFDRIEDLEALEKKQDGRIAALEGRVAALSVPVIPVDLSEIHAELDRLRAENAELRAANGKLREENGSLHTAKIDWTEENAELRKSVDVMCRDRWDEYNRPARGK